MKGKDITIIVLILVLAYLGYKFYTNSDLKNKYSTELKLREALEDTLRVYENDNNQLVAEKRTLQGSIGDLNDRNEQLTTEQQELLTNINDLNRGWNKEKEIFAAARIEYQSLIDSLNSVIVQVSEIDTTNNSLTFIDRKEESFFVYDITVWGVRPNPEDVIPELRFNYINFPNTQTVTFNFDENQRKDYPISFSVINTNPYFMASNIESYAIDGLRKEKEYKGFGKVWKWVKVNGKYILVGAGGFGAGYLLAK